MKHMTLTVLLAMTILVAGCSKGGENTATKPNLNEKLFPTALFVTEALVGKMAVAKIKADKLAPGKEVVITGVIGGRKVPLATKYATMCIVCEALPVPKEACGCGDPEWVFTCAPKDKLMPHQASVQILDGMTPIKASLEGIKGLAGGKVVSVKGTIAVNEGGGLIISATEIYIHPTVAPLVPSEKAAPAPAPAAPVAAPVVVHVHGPDCAH